MVSHLIILLKLKIFNNLITYSFVKKKKKNHPLDTVNSNHHPTTTLRHLVAAVVTARFQSRKQSIFLIFISYIHLKLQEEFLNLFLEYNAANFEFSHVN
jgi:hypothetical protein